MNKRKKLWTMKLNTASIALIPAAVAINYIGKLFAETLRLPLWLDSIGTIFAGILGGPILGALSGFINNIIYGLTISPASAVYGIASLAIGAAAGILSYYGMMNKLWKVLIAGLIIAFVSSIVSVPLNYVYYQGLTGNVWGDALFAILKTNHIPALIASFADNISVDAPDKIVSAIVAYTVFMVLPKRLTVLYDNSQETQSLD
ncbi:MAG: LytS/YhcK type 5TM receptor domain-containing protein [Sporolactobacillus sp.]